MIEFIVDSCKVKIGMPLSFRISFKKLMNKTFKDILENFFGIEYAVIWPLWHGLQ